MRYNGELIASEVAMLKSNLGGTALATRDDIKGILGDIAPAAACQL